MKLETELTPFNHRTVRRPAAFTRLPNVFVDTSAITEAEAFKITINTLSATSAATR